MKTALVVHAEAAQLESADGAILVAMLTQVPKPYFSNSIFAYPSVVSNILETGQI